MRRAAWWLPAVLVAAGCAARVFVPPTGPATPAPEAAATWTELTERCRNAQRFVAEIRVNGWVGADRQGIGRTINGAVTRTDDIYLDVMVLGSPALQMAGQRGQATFLLPRDRRVLRAATADIVAALTGLSWGPTRLLDVLTGCVAPVESLAGERIGDHLRIALSPTDRAWLRERDGQWQLVAAELGGWSLGYQSWDGPWPQVVRVTATGATPLDLEFSVGQRQVNIDLPASTFSLSVPPGFESMTLEELRSIGPLRDKGQTSWPDR